MKVANPLQLKAHFQLMIDQGLTEAAYGIGHYEYYSKFMVLTGYRDTLAFVFTSPDTDKVGLVHTSREVSRPGADVEFGDWKCELISAEDFAIWRRQHEVRFEPKFDATQTEITAEGVCPAKLRYKTGPLPGDSRITSAITSQLRKSTQRIGDLMRKTGLVPPSPCPPGGHV